MRLTQQSSPLQKSKYFNFLQIERLQTLQKPELTGARGAASLTYFDLQAEFQPTTIRGKTARKCIDDHLAQDA